LDVPVRPRLGAPLSSKGLPRFFGQAFVVLAHRFFIPAVLSWKEFFMSQTRYAALLSTLLFLPVAHAAQLRSVDVRDFDVAGVKTGMDYDQAVNAITAHFGVPASALSVDSAPAVNIVTKTKLPAHVAYKKDGEELVVHFEGRVPVDPAHPLVVESITYEIPYTVDNKNAMAKAAVAKYGIQSNAPLTNMIWCKNPGKMVSTACTNGGDTQAILKLSGTTLALNDQTWTDARINFNEKAESRAPGF
jgi:hypothetical protein